MMAGIRSKDTKPELAVRSGLHRAGFRFRLHDRRLPGHPDVVLPRHHAVVFVHGCFWHGHCCRFFRLPATREEFWSNKISRNRVNDTKTLAALAALGWRVAIAWECALRSGEPVQERSIAHLAEWVRSDSPHLELSE